MGTNCACSDPKIIQFGFLAILERKRKSISLHKRLVCEFIYSRLFARVCFWNGNDVLYRQTCIRNLSILGHHQQRPNMLRKGVSTLSHPHPVIKSLLTRQCILKQRKGLCQYETQWLSLEDLHVLPAILAVVSETPQNFLALRRSKTASPERALCGKCGQISVCLEGWQVGHCPPGCNCGFGGGLCWDGL